MKVKVIEPPLRPPELSTERLCLRLFVSEDAPVMQRIFRDPRVCIPMGAEFPYREGRAAEMISRHPRELEDGTAIHYAITLRSSNELVGSVGAKFNLHHARCFLTYWLSPDYWQQGLVTEAATAFVTYLFGTLGINRVEAFHHLDNPASRRVMEKLRMQPEGILRGHCRRADTYADTQIHAVLADEWACPEKNR